jgi:hypothetical protein
VLLKEAGGSDVFSNPSFSPDGMRVAFSASGGTHIPVRLADGKIGSRVHRGVGGVKDDYRICDTSIGISLVVRW